MSNNSAATVALWNPACLGGLGTSQSMYQAAEKYTLFFSHVTNWYSDGIPSSSLLLPSACPVCKDLISS